MRPLFQCAACGFLSTLGPEFIRVGGVLLDRQCVKDAEAGREPAAQFVAEAIAAGLKPALDHQTESQER